MITTYKLIEPVMFGSEIVTELVFQPMKARHLRTLKSGDLDMNGVLDIAIQLTGNSKHIIDDMSVPDTMEVQKIIAGFFNRGQKTGEKDSVVSPEP